MALRCQLDSYLRVLRSTVTAIAHVDAQTLHVTLSDTVLFPEGGGQPCDTGTMAGLPVTAVQAPAVHTVLLPEGTAEPPFQIGTEVECHVDWPRRWHHMQHHSGQHLITAVAEQLFGLKTTGWSLGTERSYLDLHAKLDATQAAAIEAAANVAIRARRTMVPTLLDKDDPQLAVVRSRGLPDTATGPIRIVTIEGTLKGTAAYLMSRRDGREHVLRHSCSEPGRHPARQAAELGRLQGRGAAVLCGGRLRARAVRRPQHQGVNIARSLSIHPRSRAR